MGGDSGFWVFFGGIWLLVGLGLTVVSLGALLTDAHTEADEPALAAAGGFIIRRALAVAARDKRLMQSGIQLPATVTDIRRSPIDINRQTRWHVHYRYEYTPGRPLEERGRALSSAAAEGFRPGDQIFVKVDPRQPQESVFLGAA